LLKSISRGADSCFAAALATLKSEVQHRRRLEAELLTAVETERQRIGQDLHDDLCQRLGAMSLIVDSLAKRIVLADRKLGAELAAVPPMIVETIESCRHLARGLHPVTLASRGLPAALEELSSRVPVNVQFQWPRTDRIALEPSIALHLYRIAEEAVANAVKHSGATSITIELDVVSGEPILVISDDGKGFDKKSKSKGMGLHNMQYRANVIGAQLKVGRRTGGGTSVCCRLEGRKRTRK
jgi:signal transduction histidine kinase